MMYGWGNYGWGAGAWILMGVGMLLFWAIVAFGIVMLIRYFGHTHDSPVAAVLPQKADPEGILRERLARGDIDEEEYQKRLAVLRNNS